MIICVDLDSTLLKNDLSLSDYSLNVLNKCQNNGHIIVINTARNYDRTIKIARLINADYFICNAGSQIFDRDSNLIYNEPVPKDITSKVVNYVIGLCEILSLQTEKILYTNIDREKSDRVLFKEDDSYEYNAYKILCYNLKEDISKYLDEFGLEYVNYENSKWGRISYKHLNKLFGIKKVLEKLNLYLSDVIYFGDDVGDISCIESCGTGVAVENALSCVKEVSDFVCDSNENDGVAKFLAMKFNIE